MANHKLRYLCASDVARCISMRDTIAAMRGAFIQLSSGAAVVPQRLSIDLEEKGAGGLFMPAYLPAAGLLGHKAVTIVPANTNRGLPLISALVLVADASNGLPLAVMDGAYLTALRTGAASGLATDLLAAPDASGVALIGAGRQGRTQLEAVCAVRPIQRVWVLDKDPGRAAEFARAQGQRLAIDIQATANPDKIQLADIVCTATTSPTPVFDDQHLKSGAHINAVGSYTPRMQEIPAATVQRAKLVVDSRSACLAETGDLAIPLAAGQLSADHIYAEIGELAAGELAGRESRAEITLFKSVGNAVQDVAAARCILDTANRLNIGTLLPWDPGEP